MTDLLALERRLYGAADERPSWLDIYLGEHADCWLSAFCRNPLHPGPCKGWKKTLAKVAPGVYEAMEKERVAKLEAKRKAKIAALKAEGKPIPKSLEKPHEIVPASVAAKDAPEGTASEAPVGTNEKIAAADAKFKEATAAKAKAEQAAEKKKAAAAKAAATKAANKAKKQAQADEEAKAKGAMTAAEAKAYGDSWAAAAKIIQPGMQKTGQKQTAAKAAAQAAEGPVDDSPMIQKTLDMGSKTLATKYGAKLPPEAKAKLEAQIKTELDEMTKAGLTEPPAGGVLDAIKAYQDAPKGDAAAQALDRLESVVGDVAHGPGTSKTASAKAEAFKELAADAGLMGLASTHGMLKKKLLADPNSVDNTKAADAIAEGLVKQMDTALLSDDGKAALKAALADLVKGKLDKGNVNLASIQALKTKSGAELKAAFEPEGTGAGAGGDVDKPSIPAQIQAAKASIVADGLLTATGTSAGSKQAFAKKIGEALAKGDDPGALKKAADLIAGNMSQNVAPPGASLSELMALKAHFSDAVEAAMKAGPGSSADAHAKTLLKAWQTMTTADKQVALAGLVGEASKAEGSPAPGSSAAPSTGAGGLKGKNPQGQAKAVLQGLGDVYDMMIKEAGHAEEGNSGAQLKSMANLMKLTKAIQEGKLDAKEHAKDLATKVALAAINGQITDTEIDAPPIGKVKALAEKIGQQVADAIEKGENPADLDLVVNLKSADGPTLDKLLNDTSAVPSALSPTALGTGPVAVAQGKASAAKLMNGSGPPWTVGQKKLAAYMDALESGDQDKIAKTRDALAKAMAANKLSTALAGIDLDPIAEAEVQTALAKAYKEALAAGADVPGGLAGKIDGIVADAQVKVDEAAKANGFGPNSITMEHYKESLVHAAVQKALTDTTPPASTGNAGAGGSSTPSTAVPATPPVSAGPAAPISSGSTSVAGIAYPPGQQLNPPTGIYPIGQVVAAGHEQRVADYNARVEAGIQGKEAMDVPRRRADLASTGAGAHSGNSIDNALHAYTQSSNWANSALRNNEASAAVGNGTTAARIRAMDSAFAASRLEQPITVLRGFGSPGLVFGSNWRPDTSMVGTEWRDPAYSSTTVNMNTARQFAGAGYGNPQDSVVIRLHMPAGTPAIALGANSAYGSEGEILLNRGARFRIVADNGYQNGARHLDVEVVLDGES